MTSNVFHRVSSFEKVYAIVGSIPLGKVLTYKKVAQIAGITNPRIVGFALHKNSDPKHIPCHRVVKSDGSIASGYAFGGAKKQKEKLLEEEVVFRNSDRVDLATCLWSQCWNCCRITFHENCVPSGNRTLASEKGILPSSLGSYI